MSLPELIFIAIVCSMIGPLMYWEATRLRILMGRLLKTVVSYCGKLIAAIKATSREH